MDPLLEMLLKGGVSLSVIVALCWLTVKGIGKWLSDKFDSFQASLAAAHEKAEKICIDQNKEVASRLRFVEDRNSKRDDEERVVFLRSLETFCRTNEASAKANEASSKVLARVLERFPDADKTPLKGHTI